jgi:hypothetical protein
MAETAAHLVDHVFPQLPVRQWVLSLPKRLRYFLRCDRRTVTAVLTIFLRVVEQVLRERTPRAAPKARPGVVRPILASVRYPYRADAQAPPAGCPVLTQSGHSPKTGERQPSAKTGPSL